MISKKALIGYPAGFLTGVTYGLNPLFAMPLLAAGAAVQNVLFFRYAIATILLGLFIALSSAKGMTFRVSFRQLCLLITLGVLFTFSSLLLFMAYSYIPSGLATTLVFLYPAMVAVIMAFLGKMPSWPVWASVGATFIGVAIMTGAGTGQTLDITGILLSVGSALAYSFFIVIINRSRAIAGVSNTVLTFYALLTGCLIFFIMALRDDAALTAGISGLSAWCNLVGLAVFPTIVSTATLAVATRNIGATKASVMGVFEPITAIIVGAMVLGESLTTPVIAGITISVAAVVMMIRLTGR